MATCHGPASSGFEHISVLRVQPTKDRRGRQALCNRMKFFDNGRFARLNRTQLRSLVMRKYLFYSSSRLHIAWALFISALKEDEAHLRYAFCTDRHGGLIHGPPQYIIRRWQAKSGKHVERSGLYESWRPQRGRNERRGELT